MSTKKKKAKKAKKPTTTAILANLFVKHANGGTGVAEPTAAKRRNPPRTEIDPIVKALLSAKAGRPARGIDNIGDPAPLGLDKTSFNELLGPFNHVIDNYEKSEPLKASEMTALYPKKVKDVVDAVHAKCQVH